MKIRTGSIETNHELIGEGDCLVLIHGFSDNLTMWYNQVPQFAKKHRVLAYDVRGHGSTEAPDDKISIDILAEDLYELLHALSIDKADVLGYSMGGRIASTFAIEHPDMIEGLILANSGIPGSGFRLSEEEMKAMEEKEVLMKNLLATEDIDSISEIMTAFSFSPGFQDREPEIYQKYKDIKPLNTVKQKRQLSGSLALLKAYPRYCAVLFGRFIMLKFYPGRNKLPRVFCSAENVFDPSGSFRIANFAQISLGG